MELNDYQKRDPAHSMDDNNTIETTNINIDQTSNDKNDDNNAHEVQMLEKGLEETHTECKFQKNIHAAQNQMRRTFMVLNGQSKIKLDYPYAACITLCTFTCPLIFVVLMFSIPQASPFDDADRRKAMMWNMIWPNAIYSSAVSWALVLFAEKLVWYPFCFVGFDTQERIFVTLNGIINANLFFYIGYWIFGNTPPFAYIWVQNGAIGGIGSSCAYIFWKKHWGDLSVQDRKDALVCALVAGNVFFFCGVSTMIYFALVVVYRNIEADHTTVVDGVNVVSDDATIPLLLCSGGFFIWKETFYTLVCKMYMKVNPNMITVGQIWLLFCHAFFMSIVLGGENTKPIIMVVLVILDLAGCVWALFKLLRCQTQLFTDQEKAALIETDADVNVDAEAPQNESAERSTKSIPAVRAKKMTVYEKQKLVLSKKDRESQVDMAADVLIETGNPFTKFAMYIVIAELIEAMTPIIFLAVISTLNAMPARDLIGGLNSDKFGFSKVTDFKNVTDNLFILICMELSTCGFVLFVIWWNFKINLTKAWIFICNELGTIVMIQGTTILSCVMPLLYIPYGMDAYLNFYWLD